MQYSKSFVLIISFATVILSAIIMFNNSFSILSIIAFSCFLVGFIMVLGDKFFPRTIKIIINKLKKEKRDDF